MNNASADLSRALRRLLDQMDASIRKSGYSEDPIRMFLAGGMAINYYCGIRYTQDVDAFYSRRLHPSEYMVDYKRADYVGDLSTARSSIDLICKEIAGAQSSRS